MNPISCEQTKILHRIRSRICSDNESFIVRTGPESSGVE